MQFPTQQVADACWSAIELTSWPSGTSPQTSRQLAGGSSDALKTDISPAVLCSPLSLYSLTSVHFVLLITISLILFAVLSAFFLFYFTPSYQLTDCLMHRFQSLRDYQLKWLVGPDQASTARPRPRSASPSSSSRPTVEPFYFSYMKSLL